MTEKKVPKELDAIADTVLRYRPKARSKPAVQRKRRRTILEKKRAKKGKSRGTIPCGEASPASNQEPRIPATPKKATPA